MHSQIHSVIVIGGGLSGLTTASQLQSQGIDVIVLDKGFGIGGRLASRALKSEDAVLGFFDYGMQYFSAQDREFKSWIQELIAQNIVTLWPKELQDDLSHPPLYYRGTQNNRAIAQYLAKDLTVLNQTRIETLRWQDSRWELKSTEGKIFQAQAVVMTPPVPQTLDIFENSKLDIEQEMRSRLEQITYDPCLSLMVVLDRPSQLPPSGGLLVKDSCLDWIASNHIKGISPEGYAITLLAGADFSTQYWDADSDFVIATLMEAAQPWLSTDQPNAIATRLHRWKYRQPKTVFGARSVVLKQPGPLVLAGDAFCDRIVEEQSLNLEQAFLSGRDAAQCLSKQLKE